VQRSPYCTFRIQICSSWWLLTLPIKFDKNNLSLPFLYLLRIFISLAYFYDISLPSCRRPITVHFLFPSSLIFHTFISFCFSSCLWRINCWWCSPAQSFQARVPHSFPIQFIFSCYHRFSPVSNYSRRYFGVLCFLPYSSNNSRSFDLPRILTAAADIWVLPCIAVTAAENSDFRLYSRSSSSRYLGVPLYHSNRGRELGFSPVF
jgi:hypothetical protein